MKLIVNADDFGLTRGVNYGIVESCAQGIVRSTTVIAGMSAIDHAAELIQRYPSLKTGVHLRLTAGAPMSENPVSLLGPDGNLQRQSTFWDNQKMDPKEIEMELRAQIESFLEAGFELSHIDGHHHCHKHELVHPIAEKLAAEYDVPLRPCLKPVNYKGLSIRFSDDFYGEELTTESFLSIVRQYLGKTDVLEIMVHPAMVDSELNKLSGYSLPRTQELAILTDSGLEQHLEELGVTITDYTTIS